MKGDSYGAGSEAVRTVAIAPKVPSSAAPAHSPSPATSGGGSSTETSSYAAKKDDLEEKDVETDTLKEWQPALGYYSAYSDASLSVDPRQPNINPTISTSERIETDVNISEAKVSASVSVSSSS